MEVMGRGAAAIEETVGWRSSLLLTSAISLLTATGLAVLLQDAILLLLAVVGVVLGFPVVMVLRRLPRRTQRLVLVTYVIGSGAAMAVAWGVGGVPMSSVDATALWLGAASTGVAALLLLGTDLAVTVRPSWALPSKGRLLMSSTITICVLVVGPIATASRCDAGVGLRCSLVPDPLVENGMLALATGVGVWTVLHVIAVRRSRQRALQAPSAVTGNE